MQKSKIHMLPQCLQYMKHCYPGSGLVSPRSCNKALCHERELTALHRTTASRVQDPTTVSQTETIPLSKSRESLFEVWGFLYNILTFKELCLRNGRSPNMADLKPSSAPSEDKVRWTKHCFVQVIRCWDTLMHLYHFQ